MFLVTTADQRFWKKDEKILFLGEWCKIYNQKHVWSNLEHEVLPYHWNDRKRLYQDYLHLDIVYERYLELLSEKLNKLHNVDRSTRYWRIIIGPWLFYFIEILYDRYLSIRTAIDSRLVTGTWITQITENNWTPSDFVAFQNWFVKDEYNQYLYSRIIEITEGLPFDTLNAEISTKNDHKYNIKQPNSTLAVRQLLEIYTKNLPSRFNRVVLMAGYAMDKWDLIRLQLSMRQLPNPLVPTITLENVSVKPSLRKKLLLNSATNEFESIMEWFITDQIPKVYVEGYAKMHRKSMECFPKNPSLIITDNLHYSNEGFKFWAAHQMELGTKLGGVQYGGNYGSALWTTVETHELKINDRYYTWGWQKNGDCKTIPLPASKFARLQRTLKPDQAGTILWVVTSFPRYSYWMYSAPVGPQLLHYLNEQNRFSSTVSSNVHEMLLLRLYPHDYGWNEKDRWAGVDPSLRRYHGTKSMYQQLNESRLFIGTYNATTYLETFSANFPTILFWNPKQWELRPSAKPYYDKLRKAGILHDSPESAAAKVNEIYRDPEAWWNQEEIQEVKDEFCEQFTYTSENWLKEWKKELLNLAKR